MKKKFLNFIFCFAVAKAKTSDDEKRLRKVLFNSYNTDIRPPFDNSKPLNVSLSFYLRSIQHLDDVKGLFTLLGAFEVLWNDERLVWNSSEFADLHHIVVRDTDIWTPDIVVSIGADDDAYVTSESLIRIYNTGQIYWPMGTIIKAIFQPDMTYFPFDTQNCTILVYTTRYWKHEVYTYNASHTWDMSLYSQNNEWDVVETTVNGEIWDSLPSIVRFTILVKRRSLYYTLNIVVPIVTLTVVSPMVFLLPSEGGERVTYSVTLLLSFGVFLAQVKDLTPKLSYPIPYITYFLLFAFVGSAIATVWIIINNLLYNRPEDDPVPAILCKLVWLVSFRFLLNVCKNIRRKSNVVEDSGNSKTQHQDLNSFNRTFSWKTISVYFDFIYFTFSYTIMSVIFISGVILFLNK